MKSSKDWCCCWNTSAFFYQPLQNVLEEVSLKLQKLNKMFRKVPFIWASNFPKPLCHWLEKSYFLTPSGSVHLLSVPSPACNQLAPHNESLIPLLGPWVCFFSNTQERTLQYSIKKLVPLQSPQVCQIIKTTNNIFPLFDDDKQWS